jgi:hypothetical protein
MYQELKDALNEGGIGMDDYVYRELLECRPSEDSFDIVTWEDIYDELVSQANSLGVGLGNVPTQVLNQAIFAAVAAANKISGFEDGHPSADDVCAYIARLAVWQAARDCNIAIEDDSEFGIHIAKIVDGNIELVSKLNPVAESIAHEEELVSLCVKGESLKKALTAACTPADKETAPALDSFALLHNPNLSARIYDAAQQFLREEGEAEVARLAIKHAIRQIVRDEIESTEVE